MEELFEMVTWAQLGLHQKPIGTPNTRGFFDLLIRQLDTMVDCGFLKQGNREMVLVGSSVDDLFHQLLEYTPGAVTKWISDVDQT